MAARAASATKVETLFTTCLLMLVSFHYMLRHSAYSCVAPHTSVSLPGAGGLLGYFLEWNQFRFVLSDKIDHAASGDETVVG